MNLLAIIKPAINVEQVFIQGRLNGVDIAIRISQMGIININSLFKMKQTILIGQIIDTYIYIYICIYSKNSRGPYVVPWGIPHLTVQHSEREPLTRHF